MKRGDRVAVAILAALITLLFLDVLVGINSLYIRDLALFHYPLKHVLRDIVLGGEFPAWNPFLSAGQPLAANPQHEVFYPLTWLILLPSFHLGFHWLVVVHLYIAAFAMYALLRSLALQPAASFFGALSFVFGGICLSLLNLLPYLFTIAWLPLTCLFTRRFLREGRRRDFAWAALFFGLQLLVGEPSTMFQTGVILGIYAITRRNAARNVGRVATITIVALAIAAVQLVPAVDHARQSVRAEGFSFDVVTSWSTPFARVAELLQPNLLGHQMLEGKRVFWGAVLYPKRGVPFLHSIYLGLLVTALLLAGLIAGVRGRRVVLILVTMSALLALGAHTPLWRWMYEASLVQGFRYPEKFLLMGLFAMNVFAAIVLDGLLAGDERLRKIVLRVSLGLIAITTLIAIVTVTPMHARLFIALWQPPARVLDAMLPPARWGWILAAAKALLLFVLLRNLTLVQRRTFLILLGVFVLLDLGMMLPELAPRVPRAYSTEPPALEKQFPPNRTEYRFFHVAEWQMGSAGGYIAPQRDLYWIHRNAMYPPMPATWGVRSVIEIDYDRTALQPTVDFTSLVWALSRKRPDWLNTVASMSNAWYAGVYVPQDEAFRTAHEDRRVLQPVKLIELEHHPRYYFAEHIEQVRDLRECFVKLGSARFPLRTAYIREPAFESASGIVHGVRETANSARIEVETQGRALLVMSVTPQKYWRITIDGREAQPMIVNAGFQGVVIAAKGRHIVEMHYRNPLFVAGGAVSLLALLGVGFAFRRD